MKLDRIRSAALRVRASYYLANEVVAPDDRSAWNTVPSGTINEVTLSADQKTAMDYWKRAFDVGNVEDHMK